MKTQVLVSVIAFGVTLLSGCASDRNLSKDGESIFGGGYQVTEVTPTKIYYVYAETKASMTPMPGVARRMWEEQAEKACGGRAATPINASQWIDNAKVEPLLIAAAGGYAVCVDAGLSLGEIEAEVKKYEKRQQ